MTSLKHIQNLARTIIPSMAVEEDVEISEWQKKAHAKMSELLCLPLETCDTDFTITNIEELPDYKRVTFRFQSEPNYYVPCTLLVPNHLEKPLPGVICLQGHSSGAHISVGIPKFPEDEEDIAGGRDFAVRAVKEGYCAISIEQRYMGENGQRKDTGLPACLKDNASMAALLIGRTAVGERVWDVHRLIDTIEEHLSEYIDATKIICMGNSGGGTTTFYSACYDKRISLAMPSCAVCSYDDSIMAMYHCPCNFVPNIRKYFDMGDLGSLIAPRPLVVVCGDKDPIFPLHGVKKSFETIKKTYEKHGKEESCRLVIGNGGHQFYPDDAWPIAKELFVE